jgi:hypothetical protein
MANKQSFTPAEWTKILESIMVAGIAVSAAEPSGLWGTLKEALASRSALAASKLDAASNELIKTAIADLENRDSRAAVEDAIHSRFAGAKPAEIVQRSLDNLREVSAILDAKAPAEAPAFKAFLNGISKKVADAATEGGFLGFGGARVSKAEKATLGEIAKALGTAANIA